MLAQRRRRRAQPAVDGREAERHTSAWPARRRPGGRSPRRTRAPAAADGRTASADRGRRRRARRARRAAPPPRPTSRVARSTPPSRASSSSWRARRPAYGRELGIASPTSGRPSASTNAVPLLVGGDRDREPRLVVATAVEPLRRDVRAAVAVALEQVAVGGRLQHQLGGGVERAFDHRHLEQAPAPGGLALGAARRCSANAACMPALGSLGPCWMRGWSSAMPGDPRQPGHLLHRLREARRCRATDPTARTRACARAGSAG